MKMFGFLLYCLVFTVCQTYASETRYGVLLDAGSTSTKLKVYSWASSASEESVPVVQQIYDERFSPGFSDFEDDIPGMRVYLGNIINAAKAQVPDDNQAATPIYVMATAGLRLLNLDESSGILVAIMVELADDSVNPFRYNAGQDQVQILSGEEEGVYAWIALNYLLGFFDSYKPVEDSVGVLEMGGGSTQIAFIPSDPLLSEEFQVTVANRQYSLYVQSYLQYGADAILEKEAVELLKMPSIGFGFNNRVNDPCRLTGDSLTLALQLQQERDVTLRGTSNPRKCKQIIEDLVESDRGYDCVPKPCAIGSVYQPEVHNMSFYAISAFVYVPSDLNVIPNANGNNFLNINDLESAGYDYCKKSLRQALNEGADAQYASSRCFMGLYIPALLDTYGFDRSITDQITVTSEVSGNDIDWALGAMLHQLSTAFSGETDTIAVKKRRR